MMRARAGGRAPVDSRELEPRAARRRRAAGGVPRGAWSRLAACAAAAALLQLDGTVVTVALPDLGQSVHVGAPAASTLLSAYFLAFALALIPGGRIVDRRGPRPVALAGLAIFGVAAAAGALSSSFDVLIATRVVQGAGAGLVSPAALSAAVSGFPSERRGTALGVWGASAGVANLIGPLLGGVLTQTLGWRAAWWALVVLAIGAALAVARRLPRAAGEASGRAVRAVNRVVVAAAVVAALTFAVMIGTFFLAAQYLQRASGDSPTAASAVLVVVALLVALAAPLAGRLADRRGERLPAALGFLGVALGLCLMGTDGVPLHGWPTGVALVPVGLGLGMLFAPTSRAALNSVPAEVHGRVSAVLSIGRLAGAAAGSALAGSALAAGVNVGAVHAALL
ncbi:MAG: MFS transporter, partial [Solirubrobacteraceae bacterium]